MSGLVRRVHSPQSYYQKEEFICQMFIMMLLLLCVLLVPARSIFRLSSPRLWLYENEHMIYEFSRVCPHITFKAEQCFTDEDPKRPLVKLEQVFQGNFTKNSTMQGWPNSPIVKAEFFQSGDIVIKAGALLTESLQIILFRDNTSELGTPALTLKNDSSYHLNYQKCTDIKIFNQDLLVLCLQNGQLLLDIYSIKLQNGLFQLFPLLLGKQLGIKNVELTEKYELELNSKNMAVYQKQSSSIHLFKSNFTDLSIKYLGQQNLTKILDKKTKLQICRVVFPFDDEDKYLKLITILTAKQGLIFGKIDNSTFNLFKIMSPVVSGRYLDVFRQKDDDFGHVKFFIATNNFILALQTRFQSDSLEVTNLDVEIVQKNKISRIDSVSQYMVDASFYYTMVNNLTTNTKDVIVTRRSPLIMMLYLPNITDSYLLAYDVDNTVLSGLRNRLRVLTFIPLTKDTKVTTYYFHDLYINVSASILPVGEKEHHCQVIIQDLCKNYTFNLTVLQQKYVNLSFPSQNSVAGKYISLENNQRLWDYVDGPAPGCNVLDTTGSRMMQKSINIGYNLTIPLSPIQDQPPLKLPLMYYKIFPLNEDYAQNQKNYIILIQDSSLLIMIHLVKQISGQIQSIDSESFQFSYKVKNCISFQQLLLVSSQDKKDQVVIFSVDEGEIKKVETYVPQNKIGLSVNFFFKTHPLFPDLISIIQSTVSKMLQIEVKSLHSRFSALSPYSKIPQATAFINVSEITNTSYIDFQVEYLDHGIIIGRTEDNFYHMITVDLYMNSPSRLLSTHKATEDSNIIFGFQAKNDENYEPFLIQFTNGKIFTYDILAIKAEENFVFTISKELVPFGFNLTSLLYNMNGYIVVEASKEHKKYLLVYKINDNNYNSLVDIIPMKQNVSFVKFQDRLTEVTETQYCIAWIFSDYDNTNLTLSCYIPPTLDLLMQSKSSVHDVTVEVNCSSLLASTPQMLSFHMDFVYENIGLEHKTQHVTYTPQSGIVLQELFVGPIQQCREQNNLFDYLDTNVKTLNFTIQEMCARISEDTHSKVVSKNWMLIICTSVESSSVWIIQTHNKTIRFSNDHFDQVWGNPIKQFLTEEKWIVVGKNDTGFSSFIKQSASSWNYKFQSFYLFDMEGEVFDLQPDFSRQILQFFVFVDIQANLKLDFLLLNGYIYKNIYDRTIGVYISKQGSVNHTQIYEISACDIGVNVLSASQLNVSCVFREGDYYELVMTFQTLQQYLYIVKLTLNDTVLGVKGVVTVDLSTELRKFQITPHKTELFFYQMLEITRDSCNFIITTDFIIAGITVSSNIGVSTQTVYADYMGCKNQQQVNRFGELVVLTCKFERDDEMYLKVYHRSDSPVVNITQFIQLPSDVSQSQYQDWIGWNFDVLQYGIVVEKAPFLATNFTYYSYKISSELKMDLDEHYGSVDLCCYNQFKEVCVSLVEDFQDNTLFWVFILTPISIGILMLVVGILIIKNYKQRMNQWAELVVVQSRESH